MQITDKIRKFWADNNEHGDATLLQKKTGLSRNTISRLLSGEYSKTSAKTVLEINKFYKVRAKEIKEASKID